MANTTIIDGSSDFSGGVDSSKVSTLQSALNPNGLRRNQLAWLNGATVRGGGILQRTGWKPLVDIVPSGLWQGGIIFEPERAHLPAPYLLCLISGHLYRIRMIAPFTVDDLSVFFGIFNPPTGDAYFCQAEQFCIIQAGDYLNTGQPVIPGTTDAQGHYLPLFWDGNFSTLRRSNGLTGNVTYPNINEIPAAGPMDYYMGRLWYANSRQYSAGDIVGNPTSGTNVAPYFFNYRDSILKVTENPLCVGGDGFTVPSNAGAITALKHSANINAQFGQGPLYIFTRKSVYSLNVPVTRTDWIGADNNNQPLQTVVQLVNGATSDRSVVPVNGDLFYQALDPSIRSLITAIRYFNQWGNTPISRNEQRAMQFNDRSLMNVATGIEFDNRILMGVLPKQTASGVVHQAILPLDFDIISSLDEKLPPVWEGMYEGLPILQLFTGDYGGLQRAFAVIESEIDNSIDVWELTTSDRVDQAGTNDKRVTWIVETPSFTWASSGHELDLKDLVTLELSVDKLFGKVDFKVWYRPDQYPCWIPWHQWQECATSKCIEDGTIPIDQCFYPYPDQKNYREQYRPTMTLPAPKPVCLQGRRKPSTRAYSFQIRIEITGWTRIRSLILHANVVEKPIFDDLTC